MFAPVQKQKFSRKNFHGVAALAARRARRAARRRAGRYELSFWRTRAPTGRASPRGWIVTLRRREQACESQKCVSLVQGCGQSCAREVLSDGTGLTLACVLRLALNDAMQGCERYVLRRSNKSNSMPSKTS